MYHRMFSAPLTLAALLTLSVMAAGCGGGSGAGGNAANTAATAAGQAMNAVAGQAAPIPAGLDCKGQIVWVNLSTRVYHEQGDPWYGRTKNGEYMCMAAANAHGYHLAGGGHGGGGYSNGAAGAENNGSTMTTTTSSHRRHHRNSTPSPSYT